MNNTLNIGLTLRAIDQATAPIRRIHSTIKSLQAPISSVARETSALTLKLTAIAGASGYAFKKLFVDTTAEFERLSVSLEAIEGSSEKAARALAWIDNFNKKTPLDQNTTTQAYMMLKNSGIDPTNGSLMALADSTAKIAGTHEDMIEITRQLTQAWMKEKLQQEEIIILTERGIKVRPLLSQALNKNGKALDDMIGKGKIGRKEIALLFEAMGKDAAGASEKQSKTWMGMTSTLTDLLKGVARQIMTVGEDVVTGSGAFDFLKQRLNDLITALEYLQTPEGAKQINAWGKDLRKTLEDIERGAKAAWAGLEELKNMVGSWGNLIKVVLGGITAIMAGPLLMAIATLIATFAASPILLILTAIAGVVVLIVRNWDTLVAKVKSDVDDILASFKRWGGYLVDGIGAGINGLIDGILGIGRAIKNLAQFKNPFAGGEALFPMPPAPQSAGQAQPGGKTQSRSPLDAVNNLLNFNAVPRLPLLSIETQPAPAKPKSILDFKAPSFSHRGKTIIDFKAQSFGPVKAVADRPANTQPKGKTILDFKVPSFGPAKAAPAPTTDNKPQARRVLDYKAPTLSAQGKPVPTLSSANKFDAGGHLTIKVEGAESTKVTNLKTNDRRMTYNVDAGLIMTGAR
jgi:tape measure domain-containing protein